MRETPANSDVSWMYAVSRHFERGAYFLITWKKVTGNNIAGKRVGIMFFFFYCFLLIVAM